ncbi:MAG: TetR/AcrR family transcriptional regulator [Ruminococcaceae bacterium]|nr:TetR/AcrR family transcriptional regulator [Oscillospiraceae bacterium]
MAAPRKENVKDIIMDTTEKLLTTSSLDEISLAKIAKAAGISKGTLYYHYRVKEKILLDITDRYLEQQWDNFITWTEDKEKDTSLHRLVKYVIERSVNFQGPRIHLLYNACIGNKEIQQKMVERYNRFQHVIAEKIAERIGSEHADYVSWLTLLISDGLIIQDGLVNPNIDKDEFIKHTAEIVKQVNITNNPK